MKEIQKDDFLEKVIDDFLEKVTVSKSQLEHKNQRHSAQGSILFYSGDDVDLLASQNKANAQGLVQN